MRIIAGMSAAKAKRGKPINLYFREEDRAKLRELTAYLALEGQRTSDSLIVRAAIRAAAPGRTFLQAYREVADTDLRFKE
jgi:hypothetical protein